MWKNVVGYEGEYMVSDKGEIMSLKNGKSKVLKIFYNFRGYPRVNLLKNGKMKQVFVHRLMAEAFLGEIKKGHVINHKDGNKRNNKLENIEIVTQRENIIHSFNVLGKRVKKVKMIDRKTGDVIKEFPSISKAAKENGLDDAGIYRVCTHQRNHCGGYSWEFSK